MKQRERMAHRWRVKRRRHLTIQQAARSLLAALDCGREWYEPARALRVLLAASERMGRTRKCRKAA
ncbi:MAG TPA: hypothetical protein VFW23_04800 [Tepidisphaeraceae bacterium]|nr:hypothetical protein [Tepidisphaeraceae bacterium]